MQRKIIKKYWSANPAKKFLCDLRVPAVKTYRQSMRVGFPRFASGLQKKSKKQIFLRQLQPIQVSQHRYRNLVGMEKRIRHFADFFAGD